MEEMTYRDNVDRRCSQIGKYSNRKKVAVAPTGKSVQVMSRWFPLDSDVSNTVLSVSCLIIRFSQFFSIQTEK
jgi:hypothetical protein